MTISAASPRRMARLALLPVLMLLALMMAHPPARALEEPPAVKMLLDFLRIELSVQPKVGSMRSENGDIVLSDVVLAEVRRNGKPELTVKAREIILQGAGAQDGLMHYRQIVVHDLALDMPTGNGKESFRIVMPQMLLARASILPREKAATPQEELATSQMLASALAIPEIRFEIPGVSRFSWRDIKGTWEGDRRTGAGTTRIDLGNLTVPLAEIVMALDRNKGRKTVETLHALGLTTLTFSGEAHNTSAWQPDQRMMVDSIMRLNVAEAGENTIRLSKLALPLALLQQMRRVSREMQQKRMQGKPPAPPAQALNDPQVAAAIRNLTLNKLELRWRDFGITRRLIAWEAKKRGVTEEDYIAAELQKAQARWSALLPASLAQQVVRELTRFLLEPKSLRFTLSGVGGQPIQLASLSMLLFMPQMVMNTVKLEVKANE